MIFTLLVILNLSVYYDAKKNSTFAEDNLGEHCFV